MDNSRDELGFAIERDSAGTGFVIYDTVGTNITSYIDSLEIRPKSSEGAGNIVITSIGPVYPDSV